VTQLNLPQNMACNWINVRWGWIESGCDGNDTVRSFTQHTLLLQGIEFQYTNGLMKFNLKGIDLTQLAFQTSTDKTYGDDENPISLKQAIREICDDYSCDVEFRRPGEDSSDAWNFGPPGLNGGGGDPNWAKSRFLAQGENFLQAIMRWVAPYKTDHGRGITPAFNSKIPSGSRSVLILWEDWIPRCGMLQPECSSVGTYIVNGGKDSPVISFQPNLKWQFGMLNKAGGATSPVKAEFKQEEGDKNCTTGPSDIVEQGMKTFNIVTEDAVTIYGTKTALKSTQDAQAEHTRANCSFNNIEAELKIQGDPNLADPVFLVGKRVAIVVINPFHIQDGVGSGGDCGDWLQAETCNAVLSNRSWMIKGTSHEIKEGSYTTTIKVQLVAPGSELSIGEPLGADPGGFTINPSGCG